MLEVEASVVPYSDNQNPFQELRHSIVSEVIQLDAERISRFDRLKIADDLLDRFSSVRT